MCRRLARDIDSFFRRDPSARSRLEVLFCYPGLHAVIFYRMSSCLWRWKMKFLARFVSHIARFFTSIEIHPGATIGERLFIDHGFGVVIGETATIADDVTIYHGVTLGGTSHIQEIRHPQIGNNVIIGSGAQLLGPIKVGDGARIGSNAVVVKDVKSGDTMVGVPARVAVSKKKKSSDDCDEFDAYAVSAESQDSRQKEIDAMKRELKSLRDRMGEVEGQSKDIGKTAEQWESES